MTQLAEWVLNPIEKDFGWKQIEENYEKAKKEVTDNLTN